MIQPGLIPLQPNFDFMDTFEPFQGKSHIYMCVCIYIQSINFSKVTVVYKLFFNRKLNVADLYSG